MRKTSARNGEETKKVFSYPSHGGYVTSDDQVALSKKLVQLLSHNGVIVDIDVEEEMNERGDDRNQDGDGDDSQYFDESMREVELNRSLVFLGYDGIDRSDEGDMNSVLIYVGDTMDPGEFKLPKAPDDWFDPSTNTAKGYPNLDQFYNTEGQSSFLYRAVFESVAQGGQYKGHFPPNVCHPL